MAGTSITKPTYNSSTPTDIKWLILSTDDANSYINVNGMEGSKVLLLFAHETTKVGAGSTIYIGTSDSATTRSASANLFSGAALNRMKMKVAKNAKGTVYSMFRASSSTRLMSIAICGPFETARFKDSDGYINFAKAKTGSTASRVAAILIP